MKLSALFLVVLTAVPALSVNGKCDVCPNGPDPGTAGIPGCANLETLYENVTAAEECAGIQMALMPMCCPSQMATIGKDNQCGWCPNGVSDLDVEVELPFSTESVTCGALMFGILGTTVDPDVCSFYNGIAPVCCPNGDAEVAKCEFCLSGMDNPYTVLPSSDGASCQDIKRYADLLFEGEMCENSLKPVEAMCCPSTTDNFVCDYCSRGLEFPDNMLDDSIECSELALFSSLANETTCADIKISEALCCPSSTDISLPKVSEGDYCYLCGSADVEMKRPDYQPFAIGAADGPDDLLTCAEIEQQLNDIRQPGSSCMNAVGSFTLFYSPSICGCDGFEPPNACDVCSDGTVDRAATAPGQNFTCGEGIDFLKHTSAAFCSAADDVDLDEIDATCCIYDRTIDDKQATNSDGSTNADAANIPCGNHLILMLLSVVVGVMAL